MECGLGREEGGCTQCVVKGKMKSSSSHLHSVDATRPASTAGLDTMSPKMWANDSRLTAIGWHVEDVKTSKEDGNNTTDKNKIKGADDNEEEVKQKI